MKIVANFGLSGLYSNMLAGACKLHSRVHKSKRSDKKKL